MYFRLPSAFGLRALLLALVAVLFIFLDQTSPSFHGYREKVTVLAYPVRLLVSQPILWLRKLSQGMKLQRHLIEENEQLQSREILLQSQVNQLLELQRENNQLKSLLHSSNNLTGRVIAGELLAVSLDPHLHQMVIDKGSQDQVYSGQPVFDAFGVIGQVIEVTADLSRVLLLTDLRSAIPVENYRTGFRAIAQGTGDQYRLQVNNVPGASDVKTGDLFVTSGYGGHFPQGYPVGVVNQVLQKTDKTFLDITLTPSAHLSETQQVLLVWPNQLKWDNQAQQLLSQPLPHPSG